MKKRYKRGQAVLSAWSLIAVMGMTPILSVAYPTATATVYAKEKQAEPSAVERTLGDLDTEPEKREDSKQEQKQYVEEAGEPKKAITATPSNADHGEERSEKTGKSEQNPGGGQQKTKNKDFTDSKATPSNALNVSKSLSLWGGMEMSDHSDGEGTKESPL